MHTKNKVVRTTGECARASAACRAGLAAARFARSLRSRAGRHFAAVAWLALICLFGFPVNALALPAPALTAIAPTGGPLAGGTTVSLLGSNLQAGATVTFGGQPGAGVRVISASVLTVTVRP